MRAEGNPKGLFPYPTKAQLLFYLTKFKIQERSFDSQTCKIENYRFSIPYRTQRSRWQRVPFQIATVIYGINNGN